MILLKLRFHIVDDHLIIVTPGEDFTIQFIESQAENVARVIRLHYYGGSSAIYGIGHEPEKDSSIIATYKNLCERIFNSIRILE